jgi:hypothetical protein
LLAERRLDYLDLSSAFEGQQKVNFEIDPHYNLHGHEVIARYLKAELHERYGVEIMRRLRRDHAGARGASRLPGVD